MSSPTAVWDSDYLGVYHLENEAGATADGHTDSTPNSYHGTGEGTTQPSQTTGMIGYGQDFDSGERVDLGASSRWSSIGTNDKLTFSSWVNMDNLSADACLICQYNGDGILNWMDAGGSGDGYVAYTNSTYIGDVDDTNAVVGSWQYVVFTHDDVNGRLYLNGNLIYGPTALTLDQNTLNMSIGSVFGDSTDRPMIGQMDEVRISNQARSAGWIASEYNNQSDVASFLTFDTEAASSTYSAGNYCILSNAGNPAIAVAKIDGAWSSADTSAVEISGWTTGEYNYIRVYTTDSARHNGKWSESKYRLGPLCDAIEVNDDYIWFDGLQVDSNDGYCLSILLSGDSVEQKVSNSIIRNLGGSGAGDRGIQINDGSSVMYIWNNTIYGFDDSSNAACIDKDSGPDTTVYMYNNTVYDCNRGYRENVGNVIAYNNIAQVCGEACFIGIGSSNSDYNISSDDTAPGANSSTSTTVAFLDSTNDDFHLDPDDIAARDGGTSLFHIATSSFSTDIDGTSRGGAWDIGADEVPVEYVSTICENTSAGGDCANLDYHTLATWEATVDSDITASTTRVFSGSLGRYSLTVGANVNYCNFATDLNIDGVVVATTSDQILISNITGTSTPLVVQSGHGWTIGVCDGAGHGWDLSGTDDNLGASPIAIAKIDGSWSATDTTAVGIMGWTTDNDNYIKVYTAGAARHDGKWDYTAYRRETNSALYTYEEYTRIDGLQVYASSTSGGAYGITANTTGLGDLRLSNNIIKGNVSGTADGRGINLSSGGNGAKVWNNIIYGFVNGTVSNYAIWPNSSLGYYYNNTIYNCYRGIRNEADAVMINNIISSTTSYNFPSTYHSMSDYNVSSDDTAPGQYGHSATSATVSFVSTSTGDFHLASDDTSARDSGIDLSATSTLNFTTDIDGYTRPYNGTWDIGADEYSMAVIYRSVGPGSTGALQCGGGTNNLTISSSTSLSTFNFPLSNSIGVGDAIVYNSSSSIMFISGRTSSSSYSVQKADGTAPTATSSVTDWCVFRAYTSLRELLHDTDGSDENVGIPAAVRNFDTWTAVEGRDLPASKEQWNIACYADAADTSTVYSDNWVTGEQYYIKIYTPYLASEVGVSQRHSGKYSTSAYRMEYTAGDDYQDVLEVVENYMRIEGLQFKLTNNGGYISNTAIQITSQLTAGGTDVRVSHNIIEANFSGYGSSGDGIRMADGDITSASIFNNIIYGFINGTSTPYAIYGSGGADNSIKIYNNTVYNCYEGIGTQYLDSEAKNNIVQNCVNGFIIGSNFYSTSDNNISDIGDDAPNASFTTATTTVTFVDAANKDFHLAPTSAGIDQGTSSVSSIVIDDIDGSPYPFGTGQGPGNFSYDIGADNGSVYFTSTVRASGGDFSTLSSWETANQADLTATSTLTFSCSSQSGFWPYNTSVIGTSSGAVASSTVMSTSTGQILLYNIASSTFQTGEKVILRGADGSDNYCIPGNAGNPAVARAEAYNDWPNGLDDRVELTGWTTDIYNYIKIYSPQTGLCSRCGS